MSSLQNPHKPYQSSTSLITPNKDESHKKYLFERYSELLKQMYSGMLSQDEVAGLLTQERIKLEEYSDHDGLITQFLNGKGFWKAVERTISAFDRIKELSGTVILLDVYGLQHFNDTWGHDIGDEVLRLYSGVINEQTREGDLKGRIAGDIYAIFLMGSEAKGSEIVANRIKELILADISKNFPSQSLQHSVSLGLSETKEGEQLSALIDRVYAAFEKAKS